MQTKTKIISVVTGLIIIATAAIATGFKDADTNGDGSLTIEELKAAHMDDMAANFKTIDTNKDGKISKDEAKANR